jgi:23S rRNA (guanosine2251-2'-O)-methyltransferase
MKHSPLYLFGKHAALAAINNPLRKIKRALVTKNAQKEFERELKAFKNLLVTDGEKLGAMLGKDAVHQGIAVECEPLDQPSLQNWLADHGDKPLLLLDQVTDPHNVGAILRSAVAFDMGAVVTLERNAALESGVMAKAASGALEMVPLIAVGNLAQSIELIKKAGYWIYGLDGEAKESIAGAKFDAKTALILGAEGRGMRRLTGDCCDFLVKLPMSDKMESLNVSNAAAIAMYEVYRKRV